MNELKLILLGFALMSLYGAIIFKLLKCFNSKAFEFWSISQEIQEYEYPISEIEADLRRDVMRRVKEEIEDE